MKGLPTAEGAVIEGEPSRSESLHLEIDAHVVRQLGEQLISDAEQSLLELVKNSYDADAKICSVIVDLAHQEPNTPVDKLDDEVGAANPGDDTPNVKPLVGRILVVDDGRGMDKDNIRRGWLTISLSPKREMKRLKQGSPGGRPLQGDKGLGRLGTMKLGDRVRIITYHDANKPGHKVVFAWSDCQSGVSLSQVPVHMKEIPANGRTGTTLEILGLDDPSYWNGRERTARIGRELSKLISPFQSINNFEVTIRSPGQVLSLTALPAEVLDSALAKFTFEWNGEMLIIRGYLKRELFRTGKNDDVFEEFVEDDRGISLLKFFQEFKDTKVLNLRLSSDPKWYLETKVEVDGRKDITWRSEDGSDAQDPGPFDGAFYSFLHERTAVGSIDVSSAAGEMQIFVKQMAGVHVYRSGFQTRLGKDWLGLGSAWTKGRSFYSLRPDNTIGYVLISQDNNPNLQDKSDREGFVDNASRRGFMTIASKALDEINGLILNRTRRAYVAFTKLKDEVIAGRRSSVEASAKRLSEIAEQAGAVQSRIQQTVDRRAKDLNDARQHIHTLSLQSGVSRQTAKQLDEFGKRLQELAEIMQNEQVEFNKFMGELTEHKSFAVAVSERLDEVNSQLEEVHDTLALGLAAQGLAHEVAPIIEEVVERARRMGATLKRQTGVVPVQVFGDLEFVKSQAILLGRKLAFLNPMLRTYRETRDQIQLSVFLKDFIEIRKDRYDRLGISAEVLGLPSGDMSLKVNRGRLTQVFDNLSRNSEYWLRHFATQNPGASLTIQVTMDRPVVYFSDSGYGVRPTKEETIFDMFTTDKPRGEGQGLGLYITSQILRAENCSIALAPNRNAHQRRYRFALDFSGALLT